MHDNGKLALILSLVVLLAIGTVWAVGKAGNQEKIDPALKAKISSLDPRAEVTVWVIFEDKGEASSSLARAIESSESRLTSAAYERRRLALRTDRVSLYEDVPVSRDYVRRVEDLGGRLRAVSSWLNAASFVIPAGQVEKASVLDCVKSVREVKTFRSVEYRGPSTSNALKDWKGANTLQWDFGPSEDQLNLIRAVSVLREGYNGQGANIGILDTGYRTSILALQHVNKIAEHDFLGGDQVPFYRSRNSGSWDTTGTVQQRVKLLENLALVVARDSTIHAFWEADTIRGQASARDIYHSYSTDLGSGWLATPTNISMSEELCRRPSAVASDTVYVFWEDGTDTLNPDGDQDIFMAKWYGGSLFDLTNISMNTSWSTWPSAFLEPGTPEVVHLVWMELDSVLVYANSSDWSDTHNVVYPNKDRVSPASIAVDDSGYVHIVWSTEPAGLLIHAISTDGGINWSRDTLRSSGSENPVLAVSDSVLHLFFCDFPTQAVGRVLYSRSEDRGATWSSGSALSGDLSPFLGRVNCSSSGSRVVCAWDDHRMVYVARSTDGGQNWGTTASFDLPFSYDPVVQSFGSDDYLTFKRRGDSNTDFEESQDGDHQFHHGTEMLSIMGGFRIGQLIGPSFKANYYLAKTEKYVNIVGYPHFYEMPCEEDFWIEGLEWLEAQGVDIVSSSLGYPDLYEYYRRDGKTALVSQAAHKAYKLGVLLVNAVGNARLEDTLDPGSLYPPSDADSILAVGGVLTIDGTWLSPEKGASLGFGFYSAKGPSADGRTKPDVMAPVEAYMVNPAHEDSFWYGIGTSGATALTAGVAGLLIHAHPSWRGDPGRIRDCIVGTASMHATPNDTMGWGIVRADDALHCEPVEVFPPKAESLLSPYPNPVRGDRGYVTIRFHLNEPTIPRLRIYTMSGELVWEWRSEEQMFIGTYDMNWDLKNESGDDVASGIYIVTLLGFQSTSIQKLAVVR